VEITFDQKKRDETLEQRGLDFADAAIVFEGNTLEIEDTRKEYGEKGSSAAEPFQDAWSSLDTHRVARHATFSA
jgi:uncharacterized DUF497 family protein